MYFGIIQILETNLIKRISEMWCIKVKNTRVYFGFLTPRKTNL